MKLNVKTFVWFLVRPLAWREFAKMCKLAVIKRINPPDRSIAWCQLHAKSTKETVIKITGNYTDVEIEGVHDGANVQLLYNLAEYIKAQRIIETGVCKGASSKVLLTSLKNRDGRMISTDIPIPEQWVVSGEMVPAPLRKNWTIFQQPDVTGLPRALKDMPVIDMCYYDSDKSYAGRIFGYDLLWHALRDDGIFISDDIDDNNAFKDFCETINKQPLIAESNGRYVGVIVKKQSS
jgi:predicted O-methyltransferase YrrM